MPRRNSTHHYKASESGEQPAISAPVNSDEVIVPTPQPANDIPPSSHATQNDWEADRRRYADVSHDALNTFLRSSVYQRADLLRDTLFIAVTLLVGALTLYFTGPENIKTLPLFFTALAILAVGIVANLIARAEIVAHLQQVSYQIERNYLNIYGASRDVLSNTTRTNIDTAWRVEREAPVFPNLRKRGEYGPQVSIWTIILAIIGIGLSLSFGIHF